jgi:hypothetical protein
MSVSSVYVIYDLKVDIELLACNAHVALRQEIHSKEIGNYETLYLHGGWLHVALLTCELYDRICSVAPQITQNLIIVARRTRYEP